MPTPTILATFPLSLTGEGDLTVQRNEGATPTFSVHRFGRIVRFKIRGRRMIAFTAAEAFELADTEARRIKSEQLASV